VLAKALVPIEVTPAGIAIEFRLERLNASIPIELRSEPASKVTTPRDVVW
jgi:hypothetical protein